MKRLFIIFMITLMGILIGCTKDNDTKIDLTTWDEERVYAFLNEVQQYIREIPLETTSEEQITDKYERYFTPELSVKIFESLYIKNDNSWKGQMVTQDIFL